MSNDLLEKRDERTKQRKERKKKIDSIIGLSYHDEERQVMSLSASINTVADNTVRLLDEGYCDNGFFLMKGALEKYLNGKNEHVTGWEMKNGSWQRTEVLNLTDDFVGTVNLGHKNFATDPFILGEFTKNDLTLVDTENGRQALDVGVRLDEESMFVKELRRQPYDIGVSAEFWYHVDRDATNQLEEEYGMYAPVIDEIFIFAYGLVGECGNVNSSGLELKGENTMPSENIELTAESEQNAEQLSAEQEINIDTTEDVTSEATEPEAIENAPNGEGEEAGAEEGAEDDADEGESDEAASLEEALSIVQNLKATIDELTSTIATLNETNAELKKSNRKLNKKLKTENEKKEAFLASAKEIAVELLPNEETKQTEAKELVSERNYYYGNGIGEF